MINGGSLPFKLEIKNLSTISPILGTGARDAMGIAGVIAFIVISIFMIAYYRLPGVVAVIALAGQIAGMFAAVTGFFGFNASSTLTIPGIAGIILSVGMGVDGNVLSAERIREELKARTNHRRRDQERLPARLYGYPGLQPDRNHRGSYPYARIRYCIRCFH